MDLQEVGWGHGLDCSGLGQGQVVAVVNTTMNLRVPYNAENFLTSCEPVSFSGWTQLRGVSSMFIITNHLFCSKYQ